MQTTCTRWTKTGSMRVRCSHLTRTKFIAYCNFAFETLYLTFVRSLDFDLIQFARVSVFTGPMENTGKGRLDDARDSFPDSSGDNARISLGCPKYLLIIQGYS
jgi:hypothetical protein